MSSTRGVLLPFKVIDGETIAADKYSKDSNCVQTEFLLYDITWSSGIGGLDIDVYVQYDASNGKDDWQDVGVNSPTGIKISGASGNHKIVIGGQQPNPFSRLRLFLDHNAGSCVCTAIVTGKGS